jgi:hypothetical protein
MQHPLEMLSEWHPDLPPFDEKAVRSATGSPSPVFVSLVSADDCTEVADVLGRGNCVVVRELTRDLPGYTTHAVVVLSQAVLTRILGRFMDTPNNELCEELRRLQHRVQDYLRNRHVAVLIVIPPLTDQYNTLRPYVEIIANKRYWPAAEVMMIADRTDLAGCVVRWVSSQCVCLGV